MTKSQARLILLWFAVRIHIWKVDVNYSWKSVKIQMLFFPHFSLCPTPSYYINGTPNSFPTPLPGSHCLLGPQALQSWEFWRYLSRSECLQELFITLGVVLSFYPFCEKSQTDLCVLGDCGRVWVPVWSKAHNRAECLCPSPPGEKRSYRGHQQVAWRGEEKHEAFV